MDYSLKPTILGHVGIMPYAMVETDGGKWVILNREYEPLTVPFKILGFNEKKKKEMAYTWEVNAGSEKICVIYLYSGRPAEDLSAVEWNHYLNALKILMKLRYLAYSTTNPEDEQLASLNKRMKNLHKDDTV